MIYIVDYDAGNMSSISRAIEKLGYEYLILKKYEKISKKDILIIPGVGNFNKCSNTLKQRGFFEIRHLHPNKRPYLIGICLGMQLLFSKGYEGGESDGLGIFEGSVIKTPKRNIENKKLKETLIGWASFKLKSNKSIPLWLKHFKDVSFYHIHSYMVAPKDINDIYANYINELSLIPTIAGSKIKRTIGFQFHPEKSGVKGLELLDETIKYAYNN